MGEFFSMVIPSLISIIKALLLLLLAFVAAAVVRSLVTALMKRVFPNKLTEKNPDFYKSVVAFTSKLSYIVVFLMFIPGIFTLMGVDAAAGPIILMLEGIVAFIPNIIVSVLIIYIGIMISRLCASVLEGIIKTSKIDESISKLMPQGKMCITISKLCATIVEVLLVVFFIVQGLSVLHLEILNGIGNAVIGYIPYILAASLVFVGCFCLDSFVSSFLEKDKHYGLAMLTKVVIYVIGMFMILSQLEIAPTIVNSAFVIIIAGIAIAFAMAFGIGGRDFAARILRQLEDSWKTKK